MNPVITPSMVGLMLTFSRRSNLNATNLPVGHGEGVLSDEPEVFDDPIVWNGLVSPRSVSTQPPPRSLHR